MRNTSNEFHVVALTGSLESFLSLNSFFFFLSLSNSLTEVLHKIKFVFLKSIVENTIVSCIRERISSLL